MRLEALIEQALAQGASDIHLEPGMPVAMRVRGQLNPSGPATPFDATEAMARRLVPPAEWPAFEARRSMELSSTIAGVRCRISLLYSTRGIGLAVRLLATFQATLDRLNLHPDLGKLTQGHQGLIIVSGPTGSGKSTTLAALVHEINTTQARHIVTLEHPIEYAMRPERSIIRQREVGRDTPSFEQGLIDVLRQDPDVVMVGEMRRPETMRLTLDAAETGHLVLTTMHAGTAAEALQRIASSFPAEIRDSVCSQLADSLVAVVAQRLTWLEAHRLRVPECEILTTSEGVRSLIRQGRFAQLQSAIESGGAAGMFTRERYRRWLDKRALSGLRRPARAPMAAEEVLPRRTPPIALGRTAPLQAPPLQAPPLQATPQPAAPEPVAPRPVAPAPRDTLPTRPAVASVVAPVAAPEPAPTPEPSPPPAAEATPAPDASARRRTLPPPPPRRPVEEVVVRKPPAQLVQILSELEKG